MLIKLVIMQSDYHINIKMDSARETDIRNCTYHFMDDMINMKNLDPSKIKVDKKSYKNILIYYIGHMTTNSVKSPYLIINKINSTLKKAMEMNN